jgi:hypothetical protein
MHLGVYLLLKFVHRNVIFILYFFREAFISDRVILLSYLDFHLVSMETNKISKIMLISTIIIIIKLPGASGRSLLVYDKTTNYLFCSHYFFFQLSKVKIQTSKCASMTDILGLVSSSMTTSFTLFRTQRGRFSFFQSTQNIFMFFDLNFAVVRIKSGFSCHRRNIARRFKFLETL